jgi:hypothetical protein
VAWIIYSLTTHPLAAQLPEPGGPDIRGRGQNPDMPVKEMEDTVNRAKAATDGRYRAAHRGRWASRCTDWLGFAFTSLITVIVGATGQILRQGDDAVAAADKAAAAGAFQKGTRLMIVVGVLAALSSVMVGVGSRFKSDAQTSLEEAEKLRAQIATARKEFVNATPEDARRIIDNLDNEIKKIQ